MLLMRKLYSIVRYGQPAILLPSTGDRVCAVPASHPVWSSFVLVVRQGEASAGDIKKPFPFTARLCSNLCRATERSRTAAGS